MFLREVFSLALGNEGGKKQMQEQRQNQENRGKCIDEALATRWFCRGLRKVGILN